MEPCQFVSKFCVSFSWDFEEEWSARDIQGAIFNIIKDGDTRSQDQIVCHSVQASGVGVVLTQPRSETDVVHCEMHFTAHPTASECCVTKIVVVSDARNLELFVDDMYEKTTKGYMLTLKRGKKAPLYECEFDLSAHVQGNHKVTVKFVTGDKKILKLQSVIVKVAHCPSNIPPFSLKSVNQQAVDMNNVRKMIQEMGVTPPPGAQKMMAEIEQQQKVQTEQLRNMMTASALGGAMQSMSADNVPTIQRTAGPDERYESTLTRAFVNKENWKRANEEPPQLRLRHDDVTNYQSAAPVRRDRPVSLPPSIRGTGSDGALAEMLAMYLQDKQSSRGNEPVGGQGNIAEPLSRASTPGNRLDSLSRSRMRSSQRSAAGARGDWGSVQSSRPSSVAFNDTIERLFSRVMSEADGDAPPKLVHLPTEKTRCADCGCPGCLSVYDSITTNVYASEQRIMGKVDLKMQELLGHIDSRFDSLYDSLLARQEYLVTLLMRSGTHDTAAFRTDVKGAT